MLGQSFGGFCAVTYLSQAPHGAGRGVHHRRAARPGDVGRRRIPATYPLVAAKNAAHYERYPDDVAQARRIAAYLLSKEVLLPSGAQLTVEAFQSLGKCLGMSTGSDDLHYLLEDAFDGDEISDTFRYRVQADAHVLRRAPVRDLHEACYAQQTATRWAAQRIRDQFPAFSAEAAGRRHRSDPVHRRDDLPVDA